MGIINYLPPLLDKIGESMHRVTNPVINRSILLLISLSILVMVLPTATAADSDELADSGALSGVVFNLHYDSPIPHAYVLVESNTGYIQARSTNEEGEYKFNLPYGVYEMRVFVQDQEMHNATEIYIDPSPAVHDVFISFSLDEVVYLHGVIKLSGEKARETRVVFEGLDNSYRNETVTGKDGTYALDVPIGNLFVTAYVDGDIAGEKKIGPFVVPGDYEVKIDMEYTGAPPSIDEWSSFIVTTWTGIAIWGAVVFGLIGFYYVFRKWVYQWLGSKHARVNEGQAEVMAYAATGFGKVALVYASLMVLDVVLDVGDAVAARWIRFWLYAALWIVFLWVLGRFILLLVDNLMVRLRANKVKEGSDIPETAYIFIHGILRYVVIMIIGFLILLIPLAGAGLADEISGGMNRFVDSNFGYLILLVLIVVLFFITNRFVRLTMEQMKANSTKYSPQMLAILGLVAKIGIIGLFTVLFLFTLLTMAGMQEMGALIMALLTTTVGMIVAMTTTGAMGNALSGIVLMRLKPIEPGHLVTVADGQFGTVVEISSFFTQLRTFNNEVIEIPNNLILAQDIKNFSRNKNIGIEVDMGIGYDIPADVVLDCLKNSAKGTSGIVKEPKPQAMVTDFGDYAAQYKLRAFTDNVDRYFQTKSQLMENIQEMFYTQGIEIMTPWQIMKREDAPPSKEEVIDRYMENLKHKESSLGEDAKVAAGLDMLEGNSKE
jgi:small conductance mechanosensitive channel